MHYSRHYLTASAANVRVNQWPIGWPCLPISQLVKN